MEPLPENTIPSVHHDLGLNLPAPLSRPGHPCVLTVHQSLGHPGNRKDYGSLSALASLGSATESILAQRPHPSVTQAPVTLPSWDAPSTVIPRTPTPLQYPPTPPIFLH